MPSPDARGLHQPPETLTWLAPPAGPWRGPIPVADDNNVDKFRDMFINRMATDICWKLTAHVSQEDYKCD